MRTRNAVIAGLVVFGLLAWPPAVKGGGPAGVLPIEKERIVLPAPIAFANNSARILPDSRKVLDSVAATLETHLDIARLEIGVHTDSRGSGAYNKRISQQRADAVARYLKGKGIPGERLEAVGYGEERPIASNRTAAGRAENRRVELVVGKRCPAGRIFVEGTCKPRGG